MEDLNQDDDQSINKNTNMSLSNKLNHNTNYEKSLTARLNTEESQRQFYNTFRYPKNEDQICTCQAELLTKSNQSSLPRSSSLMMSHVREDSILPN